MDVFQPKDKYKLIASYLVMAHTCSSIGKCRYISKEVSSKRLKKYKAWGYAGKPHAIDMAVRIIDSMPYQKQYRYYICKSKDQNGFASIVINFNIEVGGVKHQMGFHLPVQRASKFIISRIKKGNPIIWKNIPGCSFNACAYLKEYYNL